MSDPSSSKTDSATDYQVRIRSANQKVDDYVTNCSPTWTVLNLKEQIAKTHVNKPNVEGQRLIYAGNVLKDSSTLEQIFFRDSLCTELTNFNKKDFTIHMVSQTKPPVKSSPLPGTSTTSTSTHTTLAPSSTLPAAAAAAAAAPNSTRGGTENNPLSQQQPDRSSIPSALFGAPTTSTHFNQPNVSAPDQQYIRNFMQSDQMRQQMATFQQLACLVATQIANNMALANQGAPRRINSDTTTEPIHSTLPLPASSLSGPPLNVQINAQISTNSSSHQNENPQNVVPQLVEARQVGFGQIQAAQADYLPNPQPAVNAPIHQHDVIDWAYYSVRAFLFIVALYIHASVFRLLFIICLLMIAYFFNRRSGRRNHARNDQQQQQQRAQNRQNAPMGNVQEDAELRRRNVEGHANNNYNINNTNADAHGESQDRANPPVPNRLPFLKLCYLVVADFLTSLLPQ